MNIGKQSTLNDLGDLKKDLEAKIAAIEKNDFVEFDGLESGFDSALSGAFTATAKTSGDLYPTGGGVRAYGFVSKSETGNAGVSFMIEDSGRRAVSYKTKSYGPISDSVFFLTTNNTITDANGFIKAA